MPQRRFSYKAMLELLAAIDNDDPTEDLEGQTDCHEGCVVETDGWCPHGYWSAAATLLQEAV